MDMDKSAGDERQLDYGAPLSESVFPVKDFSEGVGFKYTCYVVKDSWKNKIKPKRRSPTVAASDFFSSIVKIDNRYFFSGVLNGWVGLTQLEVLSLSFGKKVLWSANSNGKDISIEFPHKADQIKAQLQAPDYTAYGYNKESPGYVFWADASVDGTVKSLRHGIKALEYARSPECPKGIATKVHMWGYRYAKIKESLKDQISYHSGVLIEWDHQLYCTLAELTWVNGMGGYRGNSNWLRDTYQAEEGSLYKSFPDYMKVPWIENKSELRVFDLPFRSPAQFTAFMNEYKGGRGRFIDPKIKKSSDIKLANCTHATILASCLNYIANDPSYAEHNITLSKRDAGNNCQTFAANLYGYLVSSKSKPFSRIIAPIFKARHELFTEEAPLFEDTAITTSPHA